MREGLQTQRSSEFVPPWVCLFIHQDLMHPSLGSFCFGTFRFHLKENDTFKMNPKKYEMTKACDSEKKINK